MLVANASDTDAITPSRKSFIFRSMTLLQIPFLGMIGTTELVLIVLVALLLFGGKKIPELMRGLGAGVKSFKDGIKEGEAAPSDKKSETEAPKAE